MPSPFPGMDPYLEGEEWQSFHFQFTVEMARQLAPKLRPNYVAHTPKRFVTETLETTRAREKVPHPWVEIRAVREPSVVTYIEVLLAAQKHGAGYEEHQLYRQRILESTAHLVEIDLLRNGRRFLTHQLPPRFCYFVCLSRFEKRPRGAAWPFQLSNPLPSIPIPLWEGDPDVLLDLGAAFSSVYDGLSYDLELDYSGPPPVSLFPEEEALAWELMARFRRG